jgi:hypothetical protein
VLAIAIGAAIISALTCPVSPIGRQRSARWSWVAWALVGATFVASHAVTCDTAPDRLRAIDACTHKGGKAIVRRDGWWCEMPGALP